MGCSELLVEGLIETAPTQFLMHCNCGREVIWRSRERSGLWTAYGWLKQPLGNCREAPPQWLREIRQSLLERSACAFAFRSELGKERCGLIGVPAVSRDLSNCRLHLFDRTVRIPALLNT